MVSQTPTIGELFKAKVVTEDALNGAVDTFLSGKAKAPIDLGKGHVVDVAAAVEAHKPAANAVQGNSSKG